VIQINFFSTPPVGSSEGVTAELWQGGRGGQFAPGYDEAGGEGPGPPVVGLVGVYLLREFVVEYETLAVVNKVIINWG